nr:MAG TPA: hypothetical protein [Caudoviricetes sp.]
MTIDRAKSHILTEESAGVWLFFFTKENILTDAVSFYYRK